MTCRIWAASSIGFAIVSSMCGRRRLSVDPYGEDIVTEEDIVDTASRAMHE